MYNKIEEQLIKIPKQFLEDLLENILNASKVAFNKSKESTDKGFHSSELGHQRSWQTGNQLYATAIMHDFTCIEGKGNTTSVANINGINIVRVNLNTSSRNDKIIKNKTSIELSRCNKAIESIIQPDIFDNPLDATNMFLCILITYNRKSIDPISIELFVPSSDAKECLYRIPLSKFLSKYESEEDVDTIEKGPQPKLKKVIQQLEK
ncbi:hypothetical protein [Wohlfahrtiimonas chitiniclastica]|uniref:hypothetical protein n=1 Tax=Wohlfahrtiimonas chitiniclastica TaxID=400946 RepID=UPI00215840D6|nr:hypothetical protein [Wohlfahrtiimonas chitiniclastica]MDC7252381.1 hypothetical protein [Wohlfahrtiimonas chitiniclastica]